MVSSKASSSDKLHKLRETLRRMDESLVNQLPLTIELLNLITHSNDEPAITDSLFGKVSFGKAIRDARNVQNVAESINSGYQVTNKELLLIKTSLLVSGLHNLAEACDKDGSAQKFVDALHVAMGGASENMTRDRQIMAEMALKSAFSQARKDFHHDLKAMFGRNNTLRVERGMEGAGLGGIVGALSVLPISQLIPPSAYDSSLTPIILGLGTLATLVGIPLAAWRHSYNTHIGAPVAAIDAALDVTLKQANLSEKPPKNDVVNVLHRFDDLINEHALTR